MIDLLLFFSTMVNLVLILVLWFQFYQFKEHELDQILKKIVSKMNQERRSDLKQMLSYLEDETPKSDQNNIHSSVTTDAKKIESMLKQHESELKPVSTFQSKDNNTPGDYIDSVLMPADSDDKKWMQHIYKEEQESQETQLDSLLKKQNELKKQDLVKPKGHMLSPKLIEKKIARFIGEGKSIPEMAKELGMSVGEVKLIQLMLKKKRIQS